MEAEQYAALRTTATHVMMLERLALSLGNMVGAFGRDGFPEEAFAVILPGDSEFLPGDYIKLLKLAKDKQYRAMERIARESALHRFVDTTHGLGPACYLLAGLAPNLSEFRKPSGLWKYCGLHVVDGAAPKRKKGEFSGFDMRLRAIAIARIAGTVVKVGGPYRDLYDNRKAHTAETHPPMLTEDKELAHPECEHCREAVAASKARRAASRQTRERQTVGQDCANTGGVHWTDGHRHADALRYTAKAILLDMWRVENGYGPRVGGGQERCVTQGRSAPAGASVR